MYYVYDYIKINLCYFRPEMTNKVNNFRKDYFIMRIKLHIFIWLTLNPLQSQYLAMMTNLRRIDLQRRLSNFENLFDIFDEL